MGTKPIQSVKPISPFNPFNPITRDYQSNQIAPINESSATKDVPNESNPCPTNASNNSSPLLLPTSQTTTRNSRARTRATARELNHKRDVSLSYVTKPKAKKQKLHTAYRKRTHFFSRAARRTSARSGRENNVNCTIGNMSFKNAKESNVNMYLPTLAQRIYVIFI